MGLMRKERNQISFSTKPLRVDLRKDEYTKKEIRSRKSKKDRQFNFQKKKGQKNKQRFTKLYTKR